LQDWGNEKMEGLSKEKVRKKLEGLLIKLEIANCNEEAKQDFLNEINRYWRSYDLKQYQEKANKILEEYK